MRERSPRIRRVKGVKIRVCEKKITLSVEKTYVG